MKPIKVTKEEAAGFTELHAEAIELEKVKLAFNVKVSEHWKKVAKNHKLDVVNFGYSYNQDTKEVSLMGPVPKPA